MSYPEGLLRNHASIDYAQEISEHITYHSNSCNDVVLASYQFEGFEGPEKKLLFKFTGVKSSSAHKNLRNITPDVWQNEVLDLAHCKIISQTSNEHFDSYVLSESSLFVYPDQLLLKTCGTTTLLHTVKSILDIAEQCGLEPEHVMYSRKNFIFPHLQPSPHKNFQEEVDYLDQFFAPHGVGQIVGPLKGDHWYLYMADLQPHSRLFKHPRSVTKQQTVEIMMHDLDQEVMQQFIRSDSNKHLSSFDITRRAGIADILPESVIDAFQFEPCGYSMNGLLDQYYSTIHITPEAHCSFVSYETNCSDRRLLSDLISNVADVFKPGRMTVTIMSLNDASKDGTSSIHVAHKGLSVKQKCAYEFEGGYALQFLYFERTNNYKQQQGQLYEADDDGTSSSAGSLCGDSTSDSDIEISDTFWRD
jgi:S-adenosylmethionine decarboxylase